MAQTVYYTCPAGYGYANGVCQPVATPDGVVVGAVGTAGSVVGGVVDAAAAIAGGVVNAARSIISPRVNAVTGKPTVPRHQARILTLATAPERLEVIPTAPDELFPVLLAPGAVAANRWEPDEVPYGLLGAVASNSLIRAPIDAWYFLGLSKVIRRFASGKSPTRSAMKEHYQ